MSTETLLGTMLKHDHFHNQNSMVSGIAQLAVNNGYDSLSNRQKAVLSPFLSQSCGGVTDPGGNHNDCQSVLENDELESAITNEMYYGGLLCPTCADEKENYKAQWDRIKNE